LARVQNLRVTDPAVDPLSYNVQRDIYRCGRVLNVFLN